MKLHLCGGLAAMMLLTGCGQMGPLVLPPKEESPAPKAEAQARTPVTVQPPSNSPEQASGAQPTPAPAEQKKDKP